MSFWVQLAIWATLELGTWAYGKFFTPKPDKVNRASHRDTFSIPTIQSDIPIPVLFGTADINPIVGWWGNYYFNSIENSYTGQVFFILCMGALDGADDALLGIALKDKQITGAGFVTIDIHNNTVEIDPDDGVMDINSQADTPITVVLSDGVFYGGESQNYGVLAFMKLYSGKASQTAFAELTSADFADLDDVPAFRNICSITSYGMLSGSSPTLHPIIFTMRRIPQNIPFGDDYADGDQKIASNSGQAGQFDANPAEVIYEILTNQLWGIGLPTSKIDTTSFQKAASSLKDDAIGISFVLDKSVSAGDVVGEVLRIIDGILYVDPSNDGKITINLARGEDHADYGFTPGNLTVLDESEIIQVTKFERLAWDSMINDIKINFNERNDDGLTTPNVAQAQDLAGFQVMGNFYTATVSYPMVVSPELASKLATRDLRALSMPLAKLQIRVNRKSHAFRPGDVFKFSWTEFGISEMIMRVNSVDWGNSDENEIAIEAIEDIFALKDAIFPVISQTAFIDPGLIGAGGWDDQWNFDWAGE